MRAAQFLIQLSLAGNEEASSRARVNGFDPTWQFLAGNNRLSSHQRDPSPEWRRRVSNDVDVGMRYDAHLIFAIENNQSVCVASQKKRVSLRPRNSPCPDKTRPRLPTKLTVPRVSRWRNVRGRISIRSTNIGDHFFGYFGIFITDHWVPELFVQYNFISVR